MLRRHELRDSQWERLVPLLPPQKPRVGRPAHDHRRMVNGMVWILRTGAPWRDLPDRYGPWESVASRFDRWRKAGLWDRIWAAIQTQADAHGEIDWTLNFVDGTIVRAQQHAATVKKEVCKRGAGPQPGRAEHQGASARRGAREVADLGADARPAA